MVGFTDVTGKKSRTCVTIINSFLAFRSHGDRILVVETIVVVFRGIVRISATLFAHPIIFRRDKGCRRRRHGLKKKGDKKRDLEKKGRLYIILKNQTLIARQKPFDR